MRNSRLRYNDLHSSLINTALYETIYYRGETEYELHLSPPRKEMVLDRTRALEMITGGSWWKPVLGWRSLFCWPQKINGQKYYLIGVEEVIEYPIAGSGIYHQGYLFKAQNVENIKNALHALLVLVADDNITSLLSETTKYGIWQTKSKSPDTHKVVEQEILNITINTPSKIVEKGQLAFRTLAIVPFQLDAVPNKGIVATVPHLISLWSPLGHSLSIENKHKRNYLKHLFVLIILGLKWLWKGLKTVWFWTVGFFLQQED